MENLSVHAKNLRHLPFSCVAWVRQEIRLLRTKVFTKETLDDILRNLQKMPACLPKVFTQERVHVVTQQLRNFPSHCIQGVLKAIKFFLSVFISHKRVPHLSRYFGVFAFLLLMGYAFTGLSYEFLMFLAPPFCFVSWLRVHGGFLVGIVPNELFYNNVFLLIPITFIYFGLVGFELKNILNERGKLRAVFLLAFLVFLVYLHFTTFQEINLYWAGSEKIALLTA